MLYALLASRAILYSYDHYQMTLAVGRGNGTVRPAFLSGARSEYRC